jgi:hypothetical protein
MQHGLLAREVADAVNNLIYVGNQAAHGMTIDESIGAWAREDGPKFVAVLQRLG